MPDTKPAFHLGLSIGEIYIAIRTDIRSFVKAQGYEMVNYPLKVQKGLRKEK